jgi:hypothetical protein
MFLSPSRKGGKKEENGQNLSHHRVIIGSTNKNDQRMSRMKTNDADEDRNSIFFILFV